MQLIFINYFLASIIAYLGLLLGIILIKLAPEEQKPGQKYFILFKKVLFLLIISALIFSYNINLIFSVIFFSFMTILILINKIKLEKITLAYFFLGIILYLSSKNFNLFVLNSVLIFLFGIPTSSLLIKIKKKNYYEILVKNLWFFVPIIVLYVIF